MDTVETYRIPQTRPPSPYHETTWDLKLDRVNDLLRHTKEKKIGYLELYYQGFMEFVNDGQELPEISDDDEEYPRWGGFGSARDKSSTSSATSVASRDDLCPSVTSDTPVICHTPERMLSSEHDKELCDVRSPTAADPKPPRSRRYPKHLAKPGRKPKLTSGHAATSRSRVNKQHATLSRRQHWQRNGYCAH